MRINVFIFGRRLCSLLLATALQLTTSFDAKAHSGCAAIGVTCLDQHDPGPFDDCGNPSNNGGATEDSCLICADTFRPGDSGLWAGGSRPGGNGMAWWRVSSPFMNLRIEDTPLSYRPARGKEIGFHLSYRQRGAILEDPNVFGVGTNWSTSFRACIADLSYATTGLLRFHKGGGGWTDGFDGVGTFRGGEIPSNLGGGVYQIQYRDGSKDIFSKAYTNADSIVLYFLTSQQDQAGNTTTFTYVNTNTYIKLLSVTDPDGNSTTLYYENGGFPLQITKVVSPDNRTNLLQYDEQGYLTNIVDPVGLTSGFVYDSGTRRDWITNMVTAYGTTVFSYGGVDAESSSIDTPDNQVNRYVEVTLPSGGKALYLYRLDCSSIMSSTYSPVPATALPNTFDNIDQDQRNSFYWSPLQYASLTNTVPETFTTNEYNLAHLRHWLQNVDLTVSFAVSLERLPSTEGTNWGQLTWYDYEGKTPYNNYVGTMALPSFVARVLVAGGTNYQNFTRNGFGTPTREIATYTKPDGSTGLRTNTYTFSMDNIDFVQQIGPTGEQVVSNYFNGYHQPLASYNALNEATLFTYDANHLLIKVVRPSGLTTTNIYFPSGPNINRLDTTIDLEINRTNSYTYTSGLIYSHSDERGLKTTNYWDNLERLIGVAYPDGSTISNRYTVLDITASKDRLNQWSYFGYNSVRQKIAETNVNNVVTRYGYCACGALLAITNAFGSSVQEVSSFQYDYQGNRTYTYLPEDTITNWFDPLRRVTNTASSLGNRQFVYNNQGLLTSITNSLGLEKCTVFDIEDRPISLTDANGVTVTNTYDDLGRLRTRSYPDLGRESFGYSTRGFTAFTNQIGLISYCGYDEALRRIAETNANNEITRYTNNAAGDLISFTDGKIQTTKWNYDEYGRVTNKLDQLGVEVLRYKYDADSRLTNRWNIVGGDTKYAYDPVGNLTNIDYAASSDVRFQFDALNRITNMVDGVGTTVYTYLHGGQLLTEDGPFASDTVTNVYNGRLRTGLGLQQPTGNWTNGFTYNLAAQLTSVASQAGSFDYYLAATAPASPLVKKLNLPNGAYLTNNYDTVARVLTNRLNNSSHTTLDFSAYIYDTANQRTNLARTDGSYYAFAYDNVGQLMIADSTVAAEDRGYFYDAAWNLNRRTNNGTTGTFTVDSKNQVTAAPSFSSITYYTNGNMKTKGTTYSMAYDNENRLGRWSYTQSGSGQTTGDLETDFVYDGIGRLRKRLEYHYLASGGGDGCSPQQITPDGPTGSWILDSETWYIYDGKRVIQERDGNNAPLVSYTRGTDVSGSLEGAGGIGGLLARSVNISNTWTNHAYYHADGNGNVTYMIDNSQSMVASYRYDPFGNTISKSGTICDDNIYRFSSKEIHVNSGMYYFLYRFYDPNLQRWINRDPIGEIADLNLYRFTGNSPLAYVDALGLDLFPPGSTRLWPGFPRSDPTSEPSGGPISIDLQYRKDPASCLVPPPPREWWQDWQDRIPTNSIPPWHLPQPLPRDWRIGPAGGGVKGLQVIVPWGG
jgi:RHS repeat-associated protein